MMDDEIDLLEIAGQFFQGKWTIAFFVLLFAFVGLVYAVAKPPVYQADALLQLEARAGRLALPEAMTELVDNSPETQTEIEIIKSRLVLSRASAILGLDRRMTPTLMPVLGSAFHRYPFPLPDFEVLRPYIRYGEGAALEELQVPPEWLDTEILLVSKGHEAFDIFLPDGHRLRGQAGMLVSDPKSGFRVKLSELTAGVGREFTLVQINQLDATRSLREALSVSERGRGTGVLELRLTGESPEETQLRLNAVADAYLRQNVSRSSAEAESSLEFVRGQLPEAERAVMKAEAALNAYQSEQQSVDIELETQSLLEQIRALESKLRELDAQEQDIKELYTPNHPVYRQLLAERERIAAELAELRKATSALPETQREILNLTRNLEIAQAVYVQLLNRAQELSVLKASSIGNVRIIDRAQGNSIPVEPRRMRILALACILGLVVGMGVVLLRNRLRRDVTSPDDILTLGYSVFATIGQVASKYQLQGRHSKPKLLAIEDPTDLAVEAFRSLRTSLHFSMLDAELPAIAITSPAPEAGKTFVSSNLAVVLAQTGQRVCLIDADMRRGALRKYFNISKGSVGLAEVLAGDIELEKALVLGPEPSLAILPSGKHPPNAAELLMRPSFKHTLERLKEWFDVIIIDCPPVLAVTDPVIIGKTAGTLLAVARQDKTSMGDVHAMEGTLATNGLQVAGFVLNGFDPKRLKSRYGYSYGYGYGYSYQNRTEK
ncbi:tyrosine-protein kinase Etk/Wzc [Thalassovita litoralis]|uniref:Tyrosine-protein kinase Etk/Wzc n=1 Tax=Thalassovita litoralis TaxID=1010611 RepID=A0A521EAY3_9RHOB|nr:polysaccharide biosynthesis tyrosine autokinase [Thalassovita litoralis]SMO80942.1 tyrosine-protein kinase Etk/Wzc [Thalassovita litoralis]